LGGRIELHHCLDGQRGVVADVADGEVGRQAGRKASQRRSERRKRCIASSANLSGRQLLRQLAWHHTIDGVAVLTGVGVMAKWTPSRVSVLSLVLVIWVGCSGKPLMGASLWGANVGGWLYGYMLQVSEIDSATGNVLSSDLIPGSGSRAGVLDFASDPLRHASIVWSLHNTKPYGYELLKFDPHRRQLLSSVTLDPLLELEGLAIDPTTGIFYASSSTALYQLNPSSGEATMVGPTAMPVSGALGFDLDGNLFGVRPIVGSDPPVLTAVNKLTGETTVVAEIDTLPADIAAHPETGVMYGLGYGNDPSSTYSLYKIDLTTGGATNIGPSLGRPAALAFTVVPEPASLGVALMACLGMALRRRRACWWH
jgi:hypothetical protein